MDSTINGDECEGVLIRTYRITDTCDLSTDISQNFFWRDTLPPSAAPDTLTVPCVENVPNPDPVTVNPMDDCKNGVVVDFVKDSIEVEDCTGMVFRTWRLTDDCGNVSEIEQQIVVLDTVPPEFNCPAIAPVTLFTEACSAAIDVAVIATDNCMDNTVSVTNSLDNGGANASGVFGLGVDSIVFYAVDNCDNTDSCIVVINVNEVVKPSNRCSTILVQLNGNGLYVANIDSLAMADRIGGDDFCSDVTLELDFDTLDCGDYTSFYVDSLGVAAVPYTLTVTDSSGNSSTCMNEVILGDPLDICEDDFLVVGGLVFTVANEPMPHLETQLIDGSDMAFTTTSMGGWYHFPDVPADASCQLKPYKNDDLRNGVTTYDLIKITKHILADEMLDSPYKIIAADANRSGAVTTFDVVLIRKVILHVSDEFPNNNSWRFLPAGYEFTDPTDPFLNALPEYVWINNLSQDVYGHNFIGIKIGDVNGSATVGFNGDGLEDRKGEGLLLAANDGFFEKDQMITVPIFTENEISLEALQATLEYDPKKLDFKRVIPAGLAIENTDYARIGPGSVTLSWMPQGDTPEGRILFSHDTLFYVQFQIRTSTSLSGVVFINSTKTPAIAYENGGNPLNVKWRIHKIPHTMEVDAAIFFRLEQNTPNPFGNETVIRFFLKEKMKAQLEIFDLAGRKTIAKNEEMDAGWHETKISKEMIGSSGIYFYQLTTPYGAERRKMIVQ